MPHAIYTIFQVFDAITFANSFIQERVETIDEIMGDADLIYLGIY